MATLERPDGTRIAYRDTGGDGPVVVWSHGLLMDGSMFDAQVAALPAYRHLVWDERGHGATTGDAAFDYWDSARDLLALLDATSTESAVLAGMSQGGFLSLRAALLAPDRVRALVLLDTQAGPEDPVAAPLYEAMAEDWATSGATPGLADAIATVILGPAERESWMAKWLERDPASVRGPFRALMGREDLTDRLGEISAPALVIHGSDDAAIPPGKGAELVAGLPNARPLVRIDGGGHAANLSHPDEVNAAIAAFLADLVPAR